MVIAAYTLSISATGMWTVVMALQVIALNNDPSALSAVAVCFSLGLIAFVLPSGIVADRLPQRTIVILVELSNTVVVTAIAILGIAGHLQLWHMAACATALGMCAAFFFPAYRAWLPRLLPAEQLLAANGIDGVLRTAMQQAAGPAVAGVLVGATLPALGAAAVAVLHGTSLILLTATRAVTPTRELNELPHAGPVAGLRDGFRFVAHTPWLMATLIFASAFALLVVGPFEILLPFITIQRFVDGERVFGLVVAAFGLGGVVGALSVSSIQLPRRYLSAMMLCWGLGSLPLMTIGYASSLTAMAVAAFVVGMTSSAATVIWGALLQRRVPPAMLGRVSSLDYFVSLAFMPAAAALAGPLSKVVPVQAIFVAASTTPVALAAAAWLTARMSQYEVQHPLDL